MFATGEGILTQKDGVTPDGLQQVFATNLFGHFLLVSLWRMVLTFKWSEIVGFQETRQKRFCPLVYLMEKKEKKKKTKRLILNPSVT